MEQPPAGSMRRYSAFISYSHDDMALATRLAARIERYRLPRPIARRVGFRRLRPVFRDRQELVAAPDLSEAMRKAIVQADFLIVICTPRAPASKWVALEIEMFRASHGDAHILTALFGEARQDCFPAGLLERSDGGSIEPLAAEFGRDGDGRRLGLLKIVAALAGVGLDDLVRRDRQRRRRTIAGAVLAALLLLAVLATAAGLAMHARAEADRERRRSSAAVEFQLGLTPQMRSGATLRVAAALVDGVEHQLAQASGGDPVKLRLQKAEALQLRAEIDQKRGDLPAARANALAALRITGALFARQPNDWPVVFAHAQSAFWAGAVAWRENDIVRAEAAFVFYDRLARLLIRLAPDDPRSRMELGYANSNLGMLALSEARDPTRARRAFEAALAAFVAVARAQGDPVAVYEAADGEAWLADVARLSGDYDGAYRYRARQRGLLERLLRQDPSNLLYRVDLVGNRLGLARIAAARGRTDLAARELDAALTTAAALKATDDENEAVAGEHRAVELFMVRNWLMSAPPVRPPRAAIAERLGDCDRDWRVPARRELAIFCSLLAARLALEQGRPAAARAILVRPAVAAAIGSTTLSRGWQLDFAAESAGLRGTLGAVSPPRQGEGT